MINDNFDFTKLKCQYFEVCCLYTNDGTCGFSVPCRTRQTLAHILEPDIARDNLDYQLFYLDKRDIDVE
jgi:hypothetical protein